MCGGNAEGDQSNRLGKCSEVSAIVDVGDTKEFV